MNGFLYGNDKIAELLRHGRRRNSQYRYRRMFLLFPSQIDVFVPLVHSQSAAPSLPKSADWQKHPNDTYEPRHPHHVYGLDVHASQVFHLIGPVSDQFEPSRK